MRVRGTRDRPTEPANKGRDGPNKTPGSQIVMESGDMTRQARKGRDFYVLIISFRLKSRERNIKT
jgi:hypothetical protein